MRTITFYDIEDVNPSDGAQPVEPAHHDAVTFFDISAPDEQESSNDTVVGTSFRHENAVNFFEISETNETPLVEEPTEAVEYSTADESSEADENLTVEEEDEEDSNSTVLIVEDDNIVSTMLKHLLERRGYQIEIAADGRKAADLVESDVPPALVILDVMLPFVDGFELIRKIKAKPKWEKIPIIMLTAKTREQDIVRALEAGADDYIVKPFQPQELIARVNRFVR